MAEDPAGEDLAAFRQLLASVSSSEGLLNAAAQVGPACAAAVRGGRSTIDEAAVKLGVSLALARALCAPDPVAGNFWGGVAGYTSFVSHSGAPPYQVYAQPLRMSSTLYAGTTTVFFAIVNAVKLIPYAALGQLNPSNLKVSAMLILPAVLGVWLGLKLLRIIPQDLFYKLITWALLLVSIRLIWSSVAALTGA